MIILRFITLLTYHLLCSLLLDQIPELVLSSTEKLTGSTTYKTATRDLSAAVFGKEMLATHSLTENSSNANPTKTAKPPLDPNNVYDIIGNYNHLF